MTVWELLWRPPDNERIDFLLGFKCDFGCDQREQMTMDTELTEEQEQVLFADWLRAKQIRFTASANGGSRHVIEAKKLKRMGISAGFPDIEIPYPRGPYHGLYIELKRKVRSKLSPEQIDWLSFLEGQGYYVACAKGFDCAKQVVLDYFAAFKDRD